MTVFTGCPLSFETGGTMGYNCCFFLNFVPLHIESPYNFGGTGPILGVKNPLQRVNGHGVFNIRLKQVTNLFVMTVFNLMLPTKFQFIWPSGFRGEDLF